MTDEKDTTAQAEQNEGTGPIRVRVSVNRPDGRYRAGRFWQGSQLANVTQEELKALQSDPAFAVAEIGSELDYEGMTLSELREAAQTAVDHLDRALKEAGESYGAKLEVKAPDAAAQKRLLKAQQEGDKGKGKGANVKAAPDVPQQQEQGKGGGAPDKLPDDLPFVEIFQEAGKTPADVLELSKNGQLATVPNIGAARAAEVQEWLDQNASKLGG